MALSEYEENILAELENDLKGVDSSLKEELKNLDESKGYSVNEDLDLPVSIKSFNAKKASVGFLGIILGLIFILFAVYSYSAFGVLVSVLVAVAGFAVMVFSISQMLQSFSVNKPKGKKTRK